MAEPATRCTTQIGIRSEWVGKARRPSLQRFSALTLVGEAENMPFFTQKKVHEVQSFVLKFVNSHSEVAESVELGQRRESRTRLCVVAVLIPYDARTIPVREKLPVVTKEFSSTGMSVILSEPRGYDRVVVGLKYQGEMRFILARAVHLTPMGGGFFQLGLEFLQMLHPCDHPELREVVF
ncbi:MAG: hypothetical protein WHT09_00820 [Thermogutta sp.]